MPKMSKSVSIRKKKNCAVFKENCKVLFNELNLKPTESWLLTYWIILSNISQVMIGLQFSSEDLINYSLAKIDIYATIYNRNLLLPHS